jgi:thymidylate synthase
MINQQWTKAMRAVLQSGRDVSPRGQLTRELIAYQTRVGMNSPIVTVPERKISKKFLFGEAVWILCGDNTVEGIAPYNRHIAQFSDDGKTFFGAYGPRFLDQVDYVVGNLDSDEDSRQAVMTMWRQNPRQTRDVPCTVAIQFLVRHETIHTNVTMRSSDLWLGLVYDVFNFTMITSYVALELRRRGLAIKLGDLVVTAGSQHLYARDWEKAEACIKSERMGFETPARYDMNLDEFRSSEQLITYLKLMRDGVNPPNMSSLQEVPRA